VKILVFLYDVVNDKDIKLTDADVSNEWLTSNTTGLDHESEVLLVRYVRAKTGGALSESFTFGGSGQSSARPKGSRLKRSRTSYNASISATIVRVTTATTYRQFQRNRRGLQQFPPLKSPSAR